jgi:RNA recognition motif-containing protein
MSKGCGIVEFATREEAQRAVQTLCNTKFMGRQIFVREDRDDEQIFQMGGYYGVGYSAGGNQQDIQGRQVFVGNVGLPFPPNYPIIVAKLSPVLFVFLPFILTLPRLVR